MGREYIFLAVPYLHPPRSPVRALHQICVLQLSTAHGLNREHWPRSQQTQFQHWLCCKWLHDLGQAHKWSLLLNEGLPRQSLRALLSPTRGESENEIWVKVSYVSTLDQGKWPSATKFERVKLTSQCQTFSICKWTNDSTNIIELLVKY